jgi:predicted nuclease with TOPRIM domain
MRGDKRNTREEIRRAMLRIEHRRPMRVGVDRCRMNISVVAREAGLSAASIHNTYPDLAEAIRAKAVKGSRSRLDAERRERTRLIEQLRRARERLKIVEQELARIASENARLVTENSLLRARLSSRNVISLKTTARSSRATSAA